MAYGFRCVYCGYQETSHLVGSEGEPQARGYKFSLEKCPGFKYREKDYGALVEERFDDLMGKYKYQNHQVLATDLPEGIDEQAEEMVKKHWLELGYSEDGPQMFNHEIWVILSNGQVIDIGS
jgi:hypothetical protein